MNFLKSQLFRLSRMALLATSMCVVLTIGCEKDNFDSGSGGNNGGGTSATVAGTWAGGGISVVLVEENRSPDGTVINGSATLTNPHGTFGGVWGYNRGSIYAAGDGWGLEVGSISGNQWSAQYIDTWNDVIQNVVLTKQ